MATKPSRSGLLKLAEEQLTCPVCLDHYINPKTLPCLHSFCQHCLEGLPLDKNNETYYLFCPTCRHRTELPENGAGAFPVAFTINNLKDMHSLIKKTPNSQEAVTPICTDHGRPLEFFCGTCDAVICSHCSVRNHKHHECELITDSYTKHCQKLRECLSPVVGKKEVLKKVISSLSERESEIRERGEGVLEEIHKMVEEIMSTLYQSGRKLTGQARRVTDAKLKVLSVQIKAAEKSLSLLEDVEDYVELSLKTGTPQQVLRSKKQMMEHMSEVTAQINVEELYPNEKADFVLSNNIKSIHHIGDIVTYSSTALQQCRVKRVGSFQRFPKKKTFLFSLSMEAPDSSLLSVPVSSLRCSLVPVVHTIPEINCPWGVAASDNHVTVTEFNGKCVTILDRKGKKVQSLEGGGNVKFSVPRGLAITTDKFILLSDKDKIQKIDMNGYYIASVGERGTESLQFQFPAGSANGQFMFPLGIALDSQGLVYVADCNNHRIQKFSPDGNFLAQFGTKTFGAGKLNSPYGIAIDTVGTGLVYVSEWGNHRISVFTSEGEFVTKFGKEGNNIDQFKNPKGLTFDKNGFLYICDSGNDRLVVY
ncbi:PREDICTED: RING finger protein nhl-1-like [Amphimedon queenslandica]|uniref:Uncharacterized protein n=1 Tax=Amphimedon queenslandica TaxID=400682 RepID=A0AAN0JRL9_AMPQE|nr:PREDICTED: RING finger protein nhl-1-like [Amphimedon queenslandica]|eukprot:XP_019859494.1 PREDICTED: RING finger protein nhl-1-like [Amphimedon queenslandica]